MNSGGRPWYGVGDRDKDVELLVRTQAYLVVIAEVHDFRYDENDYGFFGWVRVITRKKIIDALRAGAPHPRQSLDDEVQAGNEPRGRPCHICGFTHGGHAADNTQNPTPE